MIDGDRKTSSGQPPLKRVNRGEAGCVKFSMSVPKPGRGSVEPSPSCLEPGWSPSPHSERS